MKQLSTAPNNEATRAHLAKLKQILSVCKEQKSKITAVNAYPCSMYYGRELRRDRGVNWQTNKWEEKTTGEKFEGTKTTAKHIQITLPFADYAVTVPDELYMCFAEVLNLPLLQTEPIAADTPTEIFETPADFLEKIQKAAKFVSKEDLRPSLQCICLSFQGKQLQVVATDAHQLYMSKKYAIENGKPGQYFEVLINAKDLVALPKKAKDPVLIELLPGDRIRIAGQTFKLFTERSYVDWRCVVPSYEQSMTFDRVQLISKTKQVAVHANKSTSQVDYHLNGNISLSAQDVDFSFEATDQMPYIQKSFPDLDIAFNGKMLVNVLNTFKAAELQMYSAGKMNKPAIFTDGIDSVLLMPLYLNS